MSDVKRLQADLLAEISKRIVKEGFNARPSGQSFYRGETFGRVSFHLTFIDHETDFDVTADVAIRFDDLEELINKNNRLLTAAEKKKTASMGAELGNIKEGKPNRWTVSGQSDIGPSADSIMDKFREIGLPYLNTYSDIRTALDTLSEDDRPAWLHSPLHGERAKKAIGLAFIVGDRDKFESLIEAKRAFLESRKDFGLASFIEFAASLRKDNKAFQS